VIHNGSDLATPRSKLTAIINDKRIQKQSHQELSKLSCDGKKKTCTGEESIRTRTPSKRAC
jgi:hypothetical protein